MNVELLLPDCRLVDAAELPALTGRLQGAPPFDGSVVEACIGLSQRILRAAEARRHPELLALAFWIRKAEIVRLQQEFERLSRPDRILAPRGTVFHLPPRNVDTMFVYSWLLAALTGNRNIIRLSKQRSESTALLLHLFGEALAASAEPARSSTLVVSYGHEEEITAALTMCCDVRVIWGGDETVAAIRRVPLPSHSRELAFPDRYSMSALRSDSYLRLPEEERERLADRFFNDTFWFDQLGCSSPRLVVWCGEPRECVKASGDFFPRVCEQVRRRGVEPAAALSMRKLAFSASAILDLPVRSCRRWPELTVLALDTLSGFDRSHPGGGLFYEVNLRSLEELAPSLGRTDQTLTTFGFDDAELRSLLRLLNGSAIDRLVPVGQALQFGRFWDGHDLLTEFCRQIYFDNSPVRPVA